MFFILFNCLTKYTRHTNTETLQGYEDFLRHMKDRSLNSAQVRIVRRGRLERVASKDVTVGDIVAVKDKEKFPCDLLLLSTSSLQGKCYVMTANLDGETNLKPKLAVQQTRKFITVSFLKNLSGQIECQNPNPDLFSFSGRIELDKDLGKETFPVSLENLGLFKYSEFSYKILIFPALRGTQLRNTEYILGVAVYTGGDTKMSQNSKINSNKFSSVERTLNLCFIAYLSLLLAEVGLCLSLEYYYGLDLQHSDKLRPPHWYLGAKLNSTENIINDAVSYLILFSYIIPISVYVTLEVQRVIGSMFIIWDRELYDSASGEAAVVNSSDLNEELGQINLLFTDKTGTLTENVMVFKGETRLISLLLLIT